MPTFKYLQKSKFWRLRFACLTILLILVAFIIPSNATTTPALGQSGPVKAGQWFQVLLPKISSDPIVSFILKSDSKDLLVLASREDAAHAPLLVKKNAQGIAAVRPIEDAFVSSGQPTTSFGNSKFLAVDGSPQVFSYLKFKQPIIKSTQTNVSTSMEMNSEYSLIFWAQNASVSGFSVVPSTSSWIETGDGAITFNNQPIKAPVETTTSTTTTTTQVFTTQPPTSVVSIPASISNNCSVDVTSQIQTWINGAPDGSTLQFGAGSCYNVEGTLNITDRNDLVLDGNGSTLKQVTDGSAAPDPLKRMMFNFMRGSNLDVKNFIIQGAHPNAGTGSLAYVASREGQHGFGIHSVQKILIENNQVYDIYGDDVYIGNQGGDLSRNVTVRSNRFERNGRQGIGVVGAEDVLIEDNYIGQISRSTIDIEPNTESGAVRRLTFKNNDIGPGRLLFFANQGAAAPIEDISFIGNKLTGKTLQVQSRITGPGSGKRLRYKFIDNTSDTPTGNPSGASMVFENIDGLEVINNSVPMQSGRSMSLVSIDNVNDAHVTRNLILNGIASVKVGLNNSNYCYNGNRIGNPFVPESVTIACPSN